MEFDRMKYVCVETEEYKKLIANEVHLEYTRVSLDVAKAESYEAKREAQEYKKLYEGTQLLMKDLERELDELKNEAKQSEVQNAYS